jgi:hypothetical protein
MPKTATISNRLKGVQFVTDDSGKRTAVLLNLAELGEIWEDIYDVLVSESRKGESAVAWETLKAEVKGKRKSRAAVSH